MFAGGGTAGHINPALAIAGYLREKEPDTAIVYVGNKGGMEERLVPAAGFEFRTVHISGFQRKLTLKNIQRNLQTLGRIVTSSQEAKKIIRDFKPDICVGTGGYVSGPVLRQAARMGFRTVTHESNAYPGMTTRLIAKTADKVLLAVPEAAAHLECRREPIVTGSPVREEILFADRAAAREKLGVGDRVCILSFGGSLGAERINRAMAEVVAHFAPTGRTHHIHATGAYGTELFPECLRELGAEKIPCIHVMNKADKIMDPGELPKIDGNRIYLSAKQGYGIPALLSMIEEKLYAGNREGVFLIPYSRGELVSYLNENASVHTCEYLPEGVKIAASCRERDYERLREFCC